ncbi:MAG: hypothetical protein ACON4U_09345 [Myxococcota bacterium]
MPTLLLFCLLGLSSIWNATAHAAAYDPDLTWRTMETPHFRIHFHGEEEQLAEEMSHIVEEVYTEMTQELQWTPRLPTELVLVDNTDSANGYAMYLPVNTIVIFVTAPEGDSTLSLYEDWNDAIFTHEYTHILHMDTVEGFNKVLRGLFGRIIALNGLAPGWIIEGQATMQETWQTPGGRGRHSVPDMIKRISVLEDDFPPLDTMDGYITTWPGGNLRYLFGQDFMNYLAESYGEQVWTEWNHTYGGSLPYALPARRIFGKRLPKLYEDWKKSAYERYATQAEAIQSTGLSEYEWLTNTNDNCMGASLSPSGTHIVYACSTIYEGSSVRMHRLSDGKEKILMPNVFASDFSWRQDSEAYAYSALRTVNRFNLYSDVYLYEINGGNTMLTSADRARDPFFRPDGRELLVVTNRAQNNQIASLAIDQKLDVLTENTDHTQYGTPRFSPDGRHIAVSMWRNGQRNIWILDDQAQPIFQVTDGPSVDIDPVFSHDGQWLYYASDRTGVYNIYALSLSENLVYQVTNMLGGAFRPSPAPDNEMLIFSAYHKRGFGVAQMALNPEEWPLVESLPYSIHEIEKMSQIPPSMAPAVPPEPNIEMENGAEEISKRERRRQKNTQDKNPSPLSLPTEALEYQGLTGIGGPYHLLLGQKGHFGLPHEELFWGDEQPNTGPGIQDEAIVYEAEKKESDYEFTYPVGRYKARRTIAPRFISPGIFRTAYGFMGSLGTAGTDTLRRHSYSLSTTYRTDSKYLGWAAAYSLNTFVPVFSIGAFSYTVPVSNVYVYNGPANGNGAWVPSIQDTGQRYWDQRIRMYAQASYALNGFRSIFGGWNGSLQRPWIAPESGIRNAGLPDNVYKPFLPTRGFLSSIGGGWRYVRGMSYARSISPENTRLVSLVGQIYSPYIGSWVLDDEDNYVPFSQLKFTADWREYRSLPWFKNHVFAFKLATGLSAGDSQRYGNFRLGGSFGDSGYFTLPDEWRSLRGYFPATDSGANYYLSAIEYRLPLVWIDRGYKALPVFVRNISAAAFIDAGAAYDTTEELSAPPLVGAGAELRSSLLVSWGGGISVRGGYAFGLTEGGIPLGSADGFYGWLGGSF